MGKGTIRRFFPGNNTPQGFFPFYRYIIPEDAMRIFIFKGGPGSGKSTLMKEIGAQVNKRGFPVEYHHCSSDPPSVDAVAFPTIGVALIDGTKPHIIDPQYPGCVDEIIDLGVYWRQRGLIDSRGAIIACTREVSRTFARAYQYLKAAKAIYENWQQTNGYRLQWGLVYEKTRLLEEVVADQQPKEAPGRERHLFARAITSQGMVSHVATGVLPGIEEVYLVRGEPGTGKSYLVENLGKMALARGFDVEFFHHPLDPDRVEHLTIPQLSLAVVTGIQEGIDGGATIKAIFDMDSCLAPADGHQRAIIEEDRANLKLLMQRAIAHLAEAKKRHDQLEGYYLPHIDFAAMEGLGEELVEQILLYGVRRATRI
ncbi:MAG: ATPase [Limnochordia bacterium]|jgi:hypothetical protein